MPEFRQNLATKEWVIIDTERAMRPDQLKAAPARRAARERGETSDCPFCPGNERMSETVQHLGGEKDWRVRVVRNKFPALVPNAPRNVSIQPLYRCLPGEGLHEVIIESPGHDDSLADMETRQVLYVLEAYQQRFHASLKNDKVSLTLLFKNHGEAAGTSLEHPHSQMISSSVVPSHVRHRMDEAEKYFEKNALCVFCRMVEEERRQGARLLADTPHFAAFILFAAASPFHIWILPKRHIPSFADSKPRELEDLSVLLRDLLKRIKLGLGDPAYNYVLQSPPLDRGATDAFHWYISLVVRLGKAAGFELGSGMYINASLPEENARFLNSVK